MLQVRSTLSDFAVLIAILCCTLIDYMVGIDTPKLVVPLEFKVGLQAPLAAGG